MTFQWRNSPFSPFFTSNTVFNQENDVWKCFRLIFNPVDHPGASSRAQIAKERFFWDTCIMTWLITHRHALHYRSFVEHKAPLLAIFCILKIFYFFSIYHFYFSYQAPIYCFQWLLSSLFESDTIRSEWIALNFIILSLSERHDGKNCKIWQNIGKTLFLITALIV